MIIWIPDIKNLLLAMIMEKQACLLLQGKYNFECNPYKKVSGHAKTTQETTNWINDKNGLEKITK